MSYLKITKPANPGEKAIIISFKGIDIPTFIRWANETRRKIIDLCREGSHDVIILDFHGEEKLHFQSALRIFGNNLLKLYPQVRIINLHAFDQRLLNESILN